jgi:hypothetical protein
MTSKHGRWLTMAEIELSILQRPCLGQRFADRAAMDRELHDWTAGTSCRRGSGMTCWRRLHRVLLDELVRADQLDLVGACLDSASVPAALHADTAYDIPRCHWAPCSPRIRVRIAREETDTSEKLGWDRWGSSPTSPGGIGSGT